MFLLYVGGRRCLYLAERQSKLNGFVHCFFILVIDDAYILMNDNRSSTDSFIFFISTTDDAYILQNDN